MITKKDLVFNDAFSVAQDNADELLLTYHNYMKKTHKCHEKVKILLSRLEVDFLVNVNYVLQE